MSDFNRRLEREIPRLRRYARALTRNMVLADDLVQETLMRAVHKQHLWELGTDLRAWLFTIMHNQYVNQVKRIMVIARSLSLTNALRAWSRPLILPRRVSCANWSVRLESCRKSNVRSFYWSDLKG
jgi:DNA-directed RNA polymerase specialized sigma24 family protein